MSKVMDPKNIKKANGGAVPCNQSGAVLITPCSAAPLRRSKRQ